jgi:hypothetical protein
MSSSGCVAVTSATLPPRRSSCSEIEIVVPDPHYCTPLTTIEGCTAMTPLCLHHHGVPAAIQKSWFPIHASVPLGNRHEAMRHRDRNSASTSTSSPEPPGSPFCSTPTPLLWCSSSSSICSRPPSSTPIWSTQSSLNMMSSDPTGHHAPKHPPQPHSSLCRPHL